jgi:UPF0716 family protein affecting phage T7 exclusion
MLNLKILMNIFHPAFIKRLLYAILALSIIPVIDCILIIQLAHLLGDYLFLAFLIFLSLLGFLLSIKITVKIAARINQNLNNNTYNLNCYHDLPGSFSAAFLLIMPGIISFFLGVFCLIPRIRPALGEKVSDFLKLDWREIHEYMSIID